MLSTNNLLTLFICWTSTFTTSAFLTPLHQRHHATLKHPSLQSFTLHAKAGKGFGKPSESKSSPPSSTDTNTNTNTNTNSDNSFQLSSVDNSKLNKPVDIDPNLPTEERTAEILRQRFGMKTYEEEQGDINAIQKRKEAKERADKLKKLAAIDDGSFDIFAVLPVGLVRFIDSFLKTGLGVSTLLFVLAGVGICFEAYSKATGNPLPENVDTFIVNVIEPNFTPGLLVLLGFSVSLGLFASAQLGSASSQYQEKP